MVSVPVTAFAHLNAEKRALYRAILGVFVYERARFTIALRPPEIAAGLAARHAADPDSSPAASDNELTAALEQLVAWNNLLATRDTADVATVEEFYRSRYLYQFSAEGEAAETRLPRFFSTCSGRANYRWPRCAICSRTARDVSLKSVVRPTFCVRVNAGSSIGAPRCDYIC